MTMSESLNVPDAEVRRLAVSNFDQNVVVIAGAGTGKTTLLVHRFLSTLFRESDPISITKIVALTFTNKAALEMKVRLQDQLRALLNKTLVDDSHRTTSPIPQPPWLTGVSLADSEIKIRARAALDDFEKAQIGTLHSFAAHLLRLYPLESGVSPNFQEDNGTRFTEYFSQKWEAWLGDELGPDGPQHGRWRVLLAQLRLPVIRELAYVLSLELPTTDLVQSLTRSPESSTILKNWCNTMRDRVRTLLSLYGSSKPRKIEEALVSTEEVLTAILENGVEGWKTLHREEFQKFRSIRSAYTRMPMGWVEEHFREARGLIRVAQALVSVDHQIMVSVLEVLTPFVTRTHDEFLRSGWVTFHGLLSRARSLLRDYPVVRERLKQEYQAILVDEFQDTDPLQYEMVMFLCEQRGRCASDWRDIRLAPGKLFIVGDPKQSIYAFRGADLEAFDHIVEKILNSHGVIYELTTNFRSHASILHVVNALFEQLFRPEPHVQPRHIPLQPLPQRPQYMAQTGVELRLVLSNEHQEEEGTLAMTRHEADQLARWIKEDLLRGDILDKNTGQNMPLRPGHIGLLFRTLTASHVYLEALQRHNLPYISDGEKHFYRRQEVIEFVNLLRVLDHPGDEVAMLGLLRSPLGGLSDPEIYDLRRMSNFDYRNSAFLTGWVNPKASALHQLYVALSELHADVGLYPLGKLLEQLFVRLPVLELAMASTHGEQAVANLVKVQKIALSMADRSGLTFRRFVNLLVERIQAQPSEAEQALAEDSLEAIRVLTVHKAKGLEFPIVIVPGVHHGTQQGYEGASSVSSDWSTDVSGISVGPYSTLGGVYLKEKSRMKEEAEQRRLFYVAMTRAQERLILSGACLKRQAQGTFLRLLQAATAEPIGALGQEKITIGSISIPVSFPDISGHVWTKSRQAVSSGTTSVDLSSWMKCWEERERLRNVLTATPTHVTPTSIALTNQNVPSRSLGVEIDDERGIQVGVLTHRILEQWNFIHHWDGYKSYVARLCRQGFPYEDQDVKEVIGQEIMDMLEVFMASSLYEKLQRSKILGREVPFTIPWDCHQDQGIAITGVQSVMEGVMDLVYEFEGQTWILDYKTDRVKKQDIPGRMNAYLTQAKAYQHAAKYCLGLPDVKCQLLFLRLGETVEV